MLDDLDHYYSDRLRDKYEYDEVDREYDEYWMEMNQPETDKLKGFDEFYNIN